MTDQLPSKDQTFFLPFGHTSERLVQEEIQQQFQSLAAEIQRLREDLQRTESARVALLAENEHYKREAAEANQLLNSEWFQRVTYKQQLREARERLLRAAQPPGDGQ